jgi:Spy/CpxP family protein refolding chaperone
MKLLRLTTILAGAVAFTAACDRGPTSPDSMQAEFDAADPIVATFDATLGLPGGPFGEFAGMPFMGGMPFAAGRMGAADGRGPGAAFPDSLKLTDAQKTKIQALVAAFVVANATDLAAMRTAHQAAHAALKAGKSKEEAKAILDKAKPAAERVHAAAETLRTAIGNVLTAAQKAWLEAHKPDHPPRTP